MRRFSILLSVVVIVLLSVAVVLSRPPAAAQEATPAPAVPATADHPLVGTWAIVTEVSAEETFPSVANFNADGTYTEVLPWGQVILGAWQPTGERTVVLTQIFNYLTDDDQLVQGQGRYLLEVDQTGNRLLSYEGSSVARAQDGSIDFAEEGPPTTGTRVEAGPMLSLDELIALTEPPGAATPAAGTPVP
jgi:hypothetical protein